MKTFGVTAADRLGKLDLLVVQELFLTETAQLADIVCPRFRLREKRHHDQYGRRSATRAQGRRRDGHALRLRYPAHPFAPAWRAWAGAADPTAHSGSGVRRNSPDRAPATTCPWPRCCSAKPNAPRRFPPPMATPNSTSRPARFFPRNDTLFTSGSLRPLLHHDASLPEAAEDYVEVEEARP